VLDGGRCDPQVVVRDWAPLGPEFVFQAAVGLGREAITWKNLDRCGEGSYPLAVRIWISRVPGPVEELADHDMLVKTSSSPGNL